MASSALASLAALSPSLDPAPLALSCEDGLPGCCRIWRHQNFSDRRFVAIGIGFGAAIILAIWLLVAFFALIAFFALVIGLVLGVLLLVLAELGFILFSMLAKASLILSRTPRSLGLPCLS